MAHVLCLKEMHVISLTGRSAQLENKLVPQLVPDEMIPELLKLGCVACDAEGNVLVNGQPIAVRRMTYEADLPLPSHVAALKQQAPPPTVSEEMIIDEAVQAVVEMKDPALVDKQHGFPKAVWISERCGFKVTRIQIVASCKRLGYC